MLIMCFHFEIKFLTILLILGRLTHKTQKFNLVDLKKRQNFSNFVREKLTGSNKVEHCFFWIEKVENT